MGVCFSFGSAPHPSSLNRSHYSSNSFSSGPANAEIISGSIHEHGEEYLRLPFPFPPRDGQILKWPDLKVFDFEELKSATMDFRLDLVVGEGDLGRVYKGWLDEDTLTPTNEGSGMVVAIKMLHPESMQGFIKWQSELNFLGRLDHPNLVKLLGYCWDDDDKFLIVYEFMEKGSLENNLFTRDPNLESLSWNTRLKIAIGVALGLTFLHASENPVIHRDLKPANILLDRNYNAKISDFGLGKLGPSGGKTHVTTGVAGTYGYAAPEYRATGHLYVKSDRHEGS